MPPTAARPVAAALLGAFLACVLAMGGCAGPSWRVSTEFDPVESSEVAIIVKNTVPGPQARGAAQNVATVLAGSLASLGYTPINRGFVEELQTEIRFDQAGLTDLERDRIAGQFAQADAVLVASITRGYVKVTQYQNGVSYQTENQITIDIVDIDTGVTLASGIFGGTASAGGPDDVFAAIPGVVAEAGNSMPAVKPMCVIESRPAGARVSADGRPIGVTPARVRLLARPVTLRFELDGYQTVEIPFTPSPYPNNAGIVGMIDNSNPANNLTVPLAPEVR